MIESNKNEFAELLSGYSEAKGKTLSKSTLKFYWECLIDYSIEEVKHGLILHAKDSNSGAFFPMPADIIKHIDGTIEDSAYLAWNKIYNAKAGYYDTVIFDDPIIHSVISDMGGWMYFCEQRAQLEDRDWKFFQKEFLDRYKATRRTGVLNAPKKLVGYFESTNQIEHPENIPEPVLIGQEKQPLRLPQPAKQIESASVAMPELVKNEINQLYEQIKT